MSNLDFETLFQKAADRHGHKCPSLFYGVRSAISAIRLAQGLGIPVERATLEGKSKCINDGAGTVLAEFGITPEVVKEGCGLTIGSPQKNIRVSVRKAVREKVNELNQGLSTSEFQQAGLKYLRGLKEDELLEQVELSPTEYNQLATKAESKLTG